MKKYIFIILILIILVSVIVIYFTGSHKFTGSNKSPSYYSAGILLPAGQNYANEPIFGNPDAPVTIVEYFSYLCIHCRNFHYDTLPKISEKYIRKGKVKLVPRIYPPYEFGEAVLCANEQGKFWQYHNYLFEHIIDIIRDANKVEDSDTDKIEEIVFRNLETFAQDVGLDKDKFSKCLRGKKYEWKVKEWYEQGKKDGVEGTPCFFVNHKKIEGNQPYEVFEKVLEEELQRLE